MCLGKNLEQRNLEKNVLSDIADVLLKTVSSKSDVLDYLLDDWLDAKDEVYPRYIKVTSMRFIR